MLPRRRKTSDDEMDITPMIDVTFLLLIFFIVASKLDPQAAIDMPSAKYGSAIPPKNCVVVVVASGEGGGDNVQVFMAPTKDPAKLVDPGLTLDEQENVLTAYIDEGLHGGAGKQHVLIKAEKNVAWRHIFRVQQAASNAMTDDDTDKTIQVGVHEEKKK